MAIKFTCQCGKRFSASDEHAGRQVRCPKCGSSLKVPELEQDPLGLAIEPEPLESELPPSAFPPPVSPAVTIPPVSRSKPSALIPITIFLCVVALGVSIGGFFVYLKTAKELDKLNRCVAKMERDQKAMDDKIQAMQVLLAKKPAQPAPVKAPNVQLPPGLTDKTINSLLETILKSQGQQRKLMEDVFKDIDGTR